MPKRKIVVLGVGNLLFSDEGIGVHVVNRMMQDNILPEADIVDGGTFGFALINIIAQAKYLIVIDSIKGGGKPGSVYLFDVDEVPNFSFPPRVSIHEMGILEVIQFSELLQSKPKTTIIGVEPMTIELGMKLSPEIEEKIPVVIDLVVEKVKDYCESEQKVSCSQG